MNLTGNKIKDTYQTLVTVTNGNTLTDGTGSAITSLNISASYAPSSPSISASFATSASFTTSASLARTASFVTSASLATTASFALNGGGSSLSTGSTYPITSSWSNNTVSASYANTASWAVNATAATSATSATTASNANTASWAINAITATTASNANTASWAINATSVTSSSYASTASWAVNATSVTSASYANTSSWSVNSTTATTASYAVTSSYGITSGNTKFISTFNQSPNGTLTGSLGDIAFDSGSRFWTKVSASNESFGWASQIKLGRNNLSGTSFNPVLGPTYANFDSIMIGTNEFGSGSGGCMAVPNDFLIQDKLGNKIWFIGSHNQQPGPTPADGVIMIQPVRDIDLIPGIEGNMQIGKTGGGYNQNLFIQYNQTDGDINHGYSHKFILRGAGISGSGGPQGGVAFLGQFRGLDGYADLHIYSQEPTFVSYPSGGLQHPGVEVFSIKTGLVRSNSAVKIFKPLYEKHVSIASGSIIVDFDGGGVLDVTPITSSVTMSLTNYIESTGENTKKTVYIRSESQSLNILWPTNLTRISSDGTLTLPTTLSQSKIIIAEFENYGPSLPYTTVNVNICNDTLFNYDIDAQTYFNAVSASGVVLNNGQKTAIDHFVKNRKGSIGPHAGIDTWSSADRIAIFTGGTSGSHAIYLKGTGSITWTGSVTHSVNGVQFDGTGAFADSRYNPTTNGVSYTQNSARMLVVIPSSSAFNLPAFTSYCGANDGARYAALIKNSGVLQIQGLNSNSSETIITNTDERGLFMAVRSGSIYGSALFWHRNLEFEITGSGGYGRLTTSTNGLINANFYIGGKNDGGLYQPAAFTCCGWEVGGAVDLVKANYIRNDWLALQRNLGRS